MSETKITHWTNLAAYALNRRYGHKGKAATAGVNMEHAVAAAKELIREAEEQAEECPKI